MTRTSPSPDNRPVVECPAGRLRGRTLDGVDRFAGIPYAYPPIGARRFAPAEPLLVWTGELDAGEFGPASAQIFDPNEGSLEEFGETGPAKAWVGSEDSLTLNIWRPSGATGGLPVLIWVHGGANWLGSSRFATYHGTRLAAEGAVVVSLNYRLGIFGFLDLSPIGGPPGAHSHGLTDQMAAIEWVVANIAAFGGDPANITLMGNSAGAMNVSWHLASGRLPAGVRRIFLSSGVASAAGLGRGDDGSAHDAAEGQRVAAEFLTALGYPTFADLQAAPTGEILSRHAAALAPFIGIPEADRLFYPRTGTYAARDPFEAVAAGAAQGREVMLGFTAFEMGLWLLWDTAFDSRSPEWAAAEQVQYVPARARQAMPDLYRRWLPDEPDGRRAMHMIGDAIFAMPALFLADLLSRNGSKVFLYRFDWQVDDRLGAQHAADLPFLFGSLDSIASERLVGPAAAGPEHARREDLSRHFRRAVHGFAATGHPEIAGAPWKPYDTARRMTLLIDHTPNQVPDPLADRRAWWTANVLPRAMGGGVGLPAPPQTPKPSSTTKNHQTGQGRQR